MVKTALALAVFACMAPNGSLANPGKPECESDDRAPGPQDAKKQALDLGLVAQELLKIKGMKCEKPDPTTGLTCYGMIDGYPQDVAIVIPPNYRVKAKPDVAVHLMGFNLSNRHSGAKDLNKFFELDKGFAAGGRDAILIAPFSRGNCTDYANHLVPPEKFQAFVDRAMKVVHGAGLSGTAELGNLTLTGHSGAYTVYGPLLSKKSTVLKDKVHEILLFDSTYGYSEELAEFAAKPGNRFWSAYRPGGDEAGGSEAIQEILVGRKSPFFKGKFKKDATPSNLRNDTGFIVSGGGHDETFNAYFPLFLSHHP